ncbi:MAG: PatB family C-S lyase [Bacteroidaceae bacterium]|nr:PatB family C-S lyase [Bacteroidaceae bacterium]
MYNFDKPVDRSGSMDLKHELLNNLYGRDDLIALWVADMDWETPDFVADAIRKRMEHSLFGYTKDPRDWWQVVAGWIKEHHQWDVKPEWLTYIPGVVKGIGFVINYFLEDDEKVIVQPPIYHPFYLTPRGNKREVVWNPLKRKADGLYEMDFENLEKVADSKCKLLILANPHNPVGICWDKDTLCRLAHFCKEHGILVVSDEIHCDMAIYGHKHIPFASVSDEAAEISITFSAPSKTFNMAGIVSSWAVVPNDEMRKNFYSWLEASEFNEANMFAPIATVAAFKQGEGWRKEMLKYVEGNIDFVIDYCKANIPEIVPVRPQASFLLWLDCRALALNHEALVDLFVNKARLALNDGEMFGPGGQGFMRLNVGTQRAVLAKALEQLKAAVQQIRK